MSKCGRSVFQVPGSGFVFPFAFGRARPELPDLGTPNLGTPNLEPRTRNSNLNRNTNLEPGTRNTELHVRRS
jgi:hypothetical protein